MNKVKFTKSSAIVNELMWITGYWQSIVFDCPVESNLEFSIKRFAFNVTSGTCTKTSNQ